MSSRKGGQAKGPPRHQNSTTWKPNRNVPKNEKDLGSKTNPYPPITGVCARCRDQIAWRRKYGKYKPLTEAAKCVKCSKRNVRDAYHAACPGCARERGICPKCLQASQALVGGDLEREKEERRLLEESLGGLRERERRTLLRAMMASSAKDRKVAKAPLGGGDTKPEQEGAAEVDEAGEEEDEEDGGELLGSDSSGDEEEWSEVDEVEEPAGGPALPGGRSGS